MASDELTVDFGPLEQRGVLLGVSGLSLVAIAAGTAAGLAALFGVGGALGVLLAVAGIGFGLVVGLVPVHGVRLAEWAVVVGGYARRVTVRTTRWRASTPIEGHRVTALTPQRVDLPAPLARSHTRVVAVPFADGEAGVIVDGNLAIGVLSARAASAFLLRQPEEQAGSTAHWAEVIGAIGDSGSPWTRIQWMDTTTPVDSGGLVRFLADATTSAARMAGTPENVARTAYEHLVRGAAPVSEAHQILLAVALDPRRVARQVKDAGGGDDGLGTVTVRFLEALAYKLAAGDVLVDGMLSARQVGQVLREHIDPGERGWQSSVTGEADHEMAGVDPWSAWTLAGDEGFGQHRTDGAWHATLWVKEWPRRPSRIDFLAPLLLRSGSMTRTVSVTMAPVDPVAALRSAETAATSDDSDQELRTRFGVRTSGRRRREAHAVTRREEELLDGYDDVRFSAYVTVSAPTRALLDESVADVMTQARAARLRLVRLVGQQAEALWYTAPLCRGVQ